MLLKLIAIFFRKKYVCVDEVADGELTDLSYVWNINQGYTIVKISDFKYSYLGNNARDMNIVAKTSSFLKFSQEVNIHKS